MYGVMNEPGGTATRHRLPGVDICGKTGTAQLISNELAKTRPKGSGPQYVDNAWFVGFAPCEAPEIVAAALYEGGEHGDRAAPIVRDMIRAYFAKKARRAGAPVLTSSAN
jgi:penicillin-binding protein 2